MITHDEEIGITFMKTDQLMLNWDDATVCNVKRRNNQVGRTNNY